MNASSDTVKGAAPPSRSRSLPRGEVSKPVTRHYKISLCTTCMGRLHDLKRTLPVNLELNAKYDWVEFVILDYNSSDGLGDWIRTAMQPQLASGRVVYFRTDEPKHYSMT